MEKAESGNPGFRMYFQGWFTSKLQARYSEGKQLLIFIPLNFSSVVKLHSFQPDDWFIAELNVNQCVWFGRIHQTISSQKRRHPWLVCSWTAGSGITRAPSPAPHLLAPQGLLGWLGRPADCRDNWCFQAASSWGFTAPPPYLPLGQGWVHWNLLGWFGGCYYRGSLKRDGDPGGGNRGRGVREQWGEVGLGLVMEKRGLREGWSGGGYEEATG